MEPQKCFHSVWSTEARKANCYWREIIDSPVTIGAFQLWYMTFYFYCNNNFYLSLWFSMLPSLGCVVLIKCIILPESSCSLANLEWMLWNLELRTSKSICNCFLSFGHILHLVQCICLTIQETKWIWDVPLQP